VKGVKAHHAIVVLGVVLASAACSKAVIAPEIAVPAGESRNAVVARMATAYLGAPYAWAGASPSGFDCSGLVAYVFARAGVSIPHNAAQQFQYGIPVPREQLMAGDVVFFNRLHHNGIYLGAGRFIHSSQPGGVKITSLDDEWFRTRWVGARRL
jgi:cell wall-associated NlpC family hydrolase